MWPLTCHNYLPSHSNLSQCFFYQAAQADLWLMNLQIEADDSPPESRVLYQLCRQPQMPEQKTTRISFIIYWDLASEPWFTSCDYLGKWSKAKTSMSLPLSNELTKRPSVRICELSTHIGRNDQYHPLAWMFLDGFFFIFLKTAGVIRKKMDRDRRVLELSH